MTSWDYLQGCLRTVQIAILDDVRIVITHIYLLEVKLRASKNRSLVK